MYFLYFSGFQSPDGSQSSQSSEDKNQDHSMDEPLQDSIFAESAPSANCWRPRSATTGSLDNSSNNHQYRVRATSQGRNDDSILEEKEFEDSPDIKDQPNVPVAPPRPSRERRSRQSQIEAPDLSQLECIGKERRASVPNLFFGDGKETINKKSGLLTRTKKLFGVKTGAKENTLTICTDSKERKHSLGVTNLPLIAVHKPDEQDVQEEAGAQSRGGFRGIQSIGGSKNSDNSLERILNNLKSPSYENISVIDNVCDTFSTYSIESKKSGQSSIKDNEKDRWSLKSFRHSWSNFDDAELDRISLQSSLKRSPSPNILSMSVRKEPMKSNSSPRPVSPYSQPNIGARRIPIGRDYDCAAPDRYDTPDYVCDVTTHPRNFTAGAPTDYSLRYMSDSTDSCKMIGPNTNQYYNGNPSVLSTSSSKLVHREAHSQPKNPLVQRCQIATSASKTSLASMSNSGSSYEQSTGDGSNSFSFYVGDIYPSSGSTSDSNQFSNSGSNFDGSNRDLNSNPITISSSNPINDPLGLPHSDNLVLTGSAFPTFCADHTGKPRFESSEQKQENQPSQIEFDELCFSCK